MRRGLANGPAQEQGLAHPRLPIHQYHPAMPLLRAREQVPDHRSLCRPPAHNLFGGHPNSFSRTATAEPVK
jgi:hypothetical protein